MTHTEIKNKTGLSFEVFPPKKDDEFDNVYPILQQLAALRPDFISCTYGAGGSRAGKTIEITSYIQQQLQINAIAHITCVGFTKEDLHQNCEALRAAGVNHVLALRGDRPLSMSDEQFRQMAQQYVDSMSSTALSAEAAALVGSAAAGVVSVEVMSAPVTSVEFIDCSV